LQRGGKGWEDFNVEKYCNNEVSQQQLSQTLVQK